MGGWRRCGRTLDRFIVLKALLPHMEASRISFATYQGQKLYLPSSGKPLSTICIVSRVSLQSGKRWGYHKTMYLYGRTAECCQCCIPVALYDCGLSFLVFMVLFFVPVTPQGLSFLRRPAVASCQISWTLWTEGRP